MKAYRELHDLFQRIGELNHVQAILGWDEAAMMPPGGGEARSRAMATLNVLVHQQETDPRIKDLIYESEQEELDAWQQANLRLIKKQYLRSIAVPVDLVESGSRARSACSQAWRTMRANNNWSDLLPFLEQNLRLVREEASLIGRALALSPYDALIDQYEPGMTSERIAALFTDLKAFLPEFVDRVIERQQGRPIPSLGDYFAVSQQRELALKLMRSLGFDFDHGRLDTSLHPFCGGVADDVRITTRYTERDFLSSIMGVLHETGHALYQQGLPLAWRDQPVGEALGMGMHESQSLIMEMQACRSREFLSYLAPVASEVFGRTDDTVWSSATFYNLATHVEKDFIRVNADEVTYPLHIILRFEIEAALIGGEMEMKDLPDAWDHASRELLGISTAGNYRDGCLQDIHWMEGLFGYFPTYTLGALTAAQLFTAAKAQYPEIMSALSLGDFSVLRHWLRANVHQQGSLMTSDELLTAATGGPLDSSYFKAHLEDRYLVPIQKRQLFAQ